jgi:hypothetical protein
LLENALNDALTGLRQFDENCLQSRGSARQALLALVLRDIQIGSTSGVDLTFATP